MNDFWLKQTVDKPLYEDMLWSRPEHKKHAGKLLIVGGSAHGFSQTVSLYQSVIKAGIGTVRVLLPDSLRPMLGNSIESISYIGSNRSGGFAENSLSELLDQANWSDGVIFSPELGSNSEDKLLFEKFLAGYNDQLTLSGVAADFLIELGSNYISRPNTLFVGDRVKLAKLAQLAKSPSAITSSLDLIHLVNALNVLSKNCPINIMTKSEDNYLLATSGTICTTKIISDNQQWLIDLSAHAAVWWLQISDKTLEPLSCAMIEVQR